MTDKEQFDFWYAVNNTEVLIMPSSRLETFGTTVLNYHLVSQLMDSVTKVRIREGRIETAKPEIIVPQLLAESLLEGFGPEATEYAQWLREHEEHLYFLKYGFRVRKQESNEYIISDGLENAVDRVRAALEAKDDPLGALAVGVDKPWEVCLLKLMVEVIENSAPGNIRDLQHRDMFAKARHDPTGVRRKIEVAFRAAAKDPSKVKRVARLLQEHNLFKEYEDRFFALVRSHRAN